jgi:hypothetical protein
MTDMTDLSAEETLAGAYLRAVYAQVGGEPDDVAPAAHLQRALGWEEPIVGRIGRLLAGAGLVRLVVGGVRLTAEGRATAEEYERRGCPPPRPLDSASQRAILAPSDAGLRTAAPSPRSVSREGGRPWTRSRSYSSSPPPPAS